MVQVIEKYAICPIIIPTQMYIDTYGNQNSYIAMNPSLWIANDGSFICMVRTVNYLKYKNKAFKIYGPSSNSIYTILRGQLRNGEFQIDDANCSICTIDYNLPRSHSLGYVIEDVRFIDANTILTCIPECNNSIPCIFKGELQGSTCTNFVRCSPSHYEKNWMPFTVDGEQFVIYSVSPFVIKSCIEDSNQTISLSETLATQLQGYHGSTNGVHEEDGGFLFLIHKNVIESVIHRWLRYHPITHAIQVSEPFVCFPSSYIEFPCSLSSYDDKLFIGLGVNDSQAMIITITRPVMESYFK